MLSDAYAAKAIVDVIRALLWTQRKELGLATGKPPYGFKLAGRAGCKRLVPYPEQRAWGQKLLALKRHGFYDYRGRLVVHPSYRQIVVYLLHCCACRPDGREFSEGTVKRWVRGELLLQAEEARQREAELREGAGKSS